MPGFNEFVFFKKNNKYFYVHATASEGYITPFGNVSMSDYSKWNGLNFGNSLCYDGSQIIFVDSRDDKIVYLKNLSSSDYSLTRKDLGIKNAKKIRWNGTYYLILTQIGELYQSSDGNNFKKISTIKDICLIFTVNTLFYAVTKSGLIYNSKNGETWQEN